jgi:tryptophanyl-tRNA synthetase
LDISRHLKVLMNSTSIVAKQSSYPSGLRFEPRVISGFRPVREPHLGLHFGVLQHVIGEQDRRPGSSYSLIADWHAVTAWFGRHDLQQATLATAAALLALGINPNKTFLFVQSQVAALGEMAWLLSCMTPESILLRNTIADSSALNKNNIGAVLYPVLMAADVLSIRGTKVVIARDQIVNGHKIRQIARAANRVLEGPVFPVPSMLVRDEAGQSQNAAECDAERQIPIFRGLRELSERIRQIPTGSQGPREPKNPDTCTIFRLYAKTASADQVQEMRSRYINGQIGYEEAKRELVIAIVERFSLAVESFQEWQKRPDDLRDVLRNGASAVAGEVSATVVLVREKLGLAL